MVLEDTHKARFSAIKKAYPKAHIEPTKGSKEQAEDYINKRGKYAEKGEIIVYVARHGEIKGAQGSRRDLEIIEDMINEGKTPNEIMDMSLSYRRYDTMIKKAYFQKRNKETPTVRNVTVYWHVGLSGTGKSYSRIELAEKYGEDNIYFVTDYEHGFDLYNGEKVLFMDEFRGQMKYSQFLIITDRYKAQIAARYANIIALWGEVHITSVLPPEKVYNNMVQDDKNIDTIDQLKRRITYVVLHYKSDGEYRQEKVPMSEYSDYEALKLSVEQGFTECNEPTPFDTAEQTALPLGRTL